MSDPRTSPGEMGDVILEERIALTNLNELWRGRRREGGAAVAVKIPISPAAESALRGEVEVVTGLMAAGAKGIVPVELKTAPTVHLVSPWMGGRTFRDVLDEAQSPDDRAQALKLLLRVVDDVAFVQSRGVLHGDLKPENILVDPVGQPWLTDFGMSRVIRAARLDSRIAQSVGDGGEGWGGTLAYLPPEGLLGDPPAAAWDVYALGVMFHEALLGERPDRACTADVLRARLPGDAVDLLLKSLAYRPEDRIPTVPALKRLLDDVKDSLTRTGAARVLYGLGRVTLGGLAAFFIALRYASVLALCVSYAVLLALMFIRGWEWGFWFIPIAGAHYLIRWEGPETARQTALRKSGYVVDE
ncbi:MAG: protein kinase [Candidatus Brocadiae bacterium]|nr:protein kinase [Candidatus Brocadiia bacterium]